MVRNRRRDWKEEYLKNPVIKVIAIFTGVIGGLLVLWQFYNILPISYQSLSSIEVALKINIMLTILILVVLFVMWKEMKR